MSEATYAACLMPPGTGAIAVIAVYGPQAVRTVETLFRARSASKYPPNHLLALRAPAGRFFLGRFGDDLSDEVVLHVKEIEPFPSVEIHCHGGVEVVRMILETLQNRGIEICSWQQLEECTNDDPLQAAAVIALSEARTTRTAGILLDQYHGAFGRAVSEIIFALNREETEKAGRQLRELVQLTDLGRHLTRPWRVVVAGAPNVGKSSLVNALAGYQRAVVSPIPGTTRDVVTTEIAVDGWPIELADTAGLREVEEDLETRGIDQARFVVHKADLVLWVLDASTQTNIMPLSDGRGSFRLVVNKVDLPAAWQRSEAPEALRVSATTGEGIDQLCQALSVWLVPEPPPAGAPVPFTPELCDRVQEVWQAHKAGNWEQVRRVLAAFATDSSHAAVRHPETVKIRADLKADS